MESLREPVEGVSAMNIRKSSKLLLTRARSENEMKSLYAKLGRGINKRRSPNDLGH